jgi:membrane fusion protein, copper/silver efflux system
MATEHDLPEGPEPPPRGVRVMGLVRWIILGLAALVALGSLLSLARAQRPASPTGAGHVHVWKYQCPMHPQVVSDEPGECPICHMTLEPIATARAGADGGAADAADDAGSIPPGTAAVDLTLDRVQAIGVRTALAQADKTRAPLRVTASVAPPDQGVAEVHVRAAGFVERIDASQLGVSVGRGQTLFWLYSPEIFQAQSELVSTRAWEGDAGARMQERARSKLELLGMAPKDIEQVAASGQPMRVIPIAAPQAGYVAKKNVVLGSYVTPEMALYELVDLSRVYVVADVFQRDMALVHVGIAGKFVPNGRPEDTIEGTVDLIYPALDAEARTTRVRMQVKNAGRALKPGEYGTVDLAVAGRDVVTVPRDAIVDTGTAIYVFVVPADGRYVPRAVTVGGAVGDLTLVTGGLAPGERVVSGATFLVDSESRLRAAIGSAR